MSTADGSALGTAALRRHQPLSGIISNSLLYLRKQLALRLEGFAVRPGIPARIANSLRAHHPIIVAPGIALVTRYDDVCEVLRDSDHFDMNYPKTGPDQIVAMSDTPEFQHHLRIMSEAAHPEAVSLPTVVRDFAERLLDAANGRIDMVGGFSRHIAIMLTDRFLGVHAPPLSMMRWTRAVFRNVFTNFSNDPLMTAEAARALARLNRRIEQCIAICANAVDHDQPVHGFLHRLLWNDARRIAHGAQPLKTEVVRNIVAGLACAMSETVSTAIAYTIKYLFDNPRHLPGAIQAAHAHDLDLLNHYVYEALRFYPAIPFLPRRTARNAIIARMTSRAVLIPENTLVLAATSSAMFDPLAFKDPSTFRLDRDLDRYLHFGAGIHRCFGEPLTRMIVPEATGSLLRRNGLQPAQGADGRMRFDGGFPDKMMIEFEAWHAS